MTKPEEYLSSIDQREPVSSCYQEADEGRTVRGNPQGLSASRIAGVSSHPNGREYQERLREQLVGAQ